ncbi:MAG: DUF2807 domain-containing protein [Bacteroidales bacterium]|nr:DUF2807 domain-containing protein [Bacteroidales bacterium]
MKAKTNHLFYTLFFLVFSSLISCVSSQSFLPVKGSGMPVEKNYTVSGFKGLDVSGGFDVVLVQGNTEGVVLTAQENLFGYIKVEVVQGVLRIYTEANIMPTKPMKAWVSFKSIEKLEVSGGGDVVAETPVNVPGLDMAISGGGDLTLTVNTAELNGKISGGGDARLDGSAENFVVVMSGGGDLSSSLEAGNIACTLSGGGDLNIKNPVRAFAITLEVSGGGDVEALLEADRLKCAVSGGGNASFSGNVTDLEIHVSGGGDIDAAGLVARKASVEAGGGSDVHVHVSDELKGNISGGGDIYFAGNPAIVSIDTKGGSEIHKE